MENKEHKFSQEGAGGDGYERSYSYQRCSECRAAFTHYYHIEGYTEAQKKARISEYCVKK